MGHSFIPSTRRGARWVLTAVEMRAADAHTIEKIGIPGLVLMENAGRHVARAVARLAPAGARIGVVCGRGNNGGDGLVAARHLADWGYAVEVVLCARPDQLAGEPAVNWAVLEALGLSLRTITEPVEFGLLPAPGHFDVLIDALLGTGLSGPIRSTAAEGVAWINGHGARVVAVDIPSGLCADTGMPLGDAVRADVTVTFAASKLGHWLYPGARYRGRLEIVDIGIPEEVLAAQGVAARRRVLDDDTVAVAWPRRAPNAHKGTFGHLYLLAGSAGRIGAARMAADAALRAGAGLVTVGTTADALPILAGSLYEAMAEASLGTGEPPAATAGRLAERINACEAAVLGPGMSTDEEAGQALTHLLPLLKVPVVIDADAINHLARDPRALKKAALKVLTPHPGEAARLLGTTAAKVQSDRPAAALSLARELDAVVALKGAHTLVVAPDGRMGICPDGNPGMATAGMGDVLSGVIGALLARGVEPFEAAGAGVVWHARAGDLAREWRSESAVIARDVIAALADVERQTCFVD